MGLSKRASIFTPDLGGLALTPATSESTPRIQYQVKLETAVATEEDLLELLKTEHPELFDENGEVLNNAEQIAEGISATRKGLKDVLAGE